MAPPTGTFDQTLSKKLWRLMMGGVEGGAGATDEEKDRRHPMGRGGPRASPLDTIQWG